VSEKDRHPGGWRSFLLLALKIVFIAAKIVKFCELTQYLGLFAGIYAEVYDLGAGLFLVCLPEGFCDALCESRFLLLFHGAKIRKKAGTSQLRPRVFYLKSNKLDT